MTNVKKRSAAQADLFSGVKRLKENSTTWEVLDHGEVPWDKTRGKT